MREITIRDCEVVSGGFGLAGAGIGAVSGGLMYVGATVGYGSLASTGYFVSAVAAGAFVGSVLESADTSAMQLGVAAAAGPNVAFYGGIFFGMVAGGIGSLSAAGIFRAAQMEHCAAV